MERVLQILSTEVMVAVAWEQQLEEISEQLAKLPVDLETAVEVATEAAM